MLTVSGTCNGGYKSENGVSPSTQTDVVHYRMLGLKHNLLLGDVTGCYLSSILAGVRGVEVYPLQSAVKVAFQDLHNI